MTATTPCKVRSHLIEALQLDLVGPNPDDIDHGEEIIDQAPSKWYLTGFLVPYGASVEQRADDAGDDELDEIGRVGGGDDENVPEKTFAKKAFFPSSMGLSLLVNENTSHLNATVTWGDYSPYKESIDREILENIDIAIENSTIPQAEQLEPAEENPEKQNPEKQTLSGCWKRTPHQEKITIPIQEHNSSEQVELNLGLDNPKQLKLSLDCKHSQNLTIPIPDSNGLQMVVSVRPVPSKQLLPAGTLSVSVFLVNNRIPSNEKERDITYTFQTSLVIHTSEPLVPRPNLRGRDNNDWDESVADLQYRDDYEYAVGHNVSAIAITNPDGSCNHIHTAWIPTADVEKVIATEVTNVEFGMEEIAKAPTPEALQNMLSPMVDAYGDWVQQQQVKSPTEPKRLNVANDLLKRAEIAKNRINTGIQALTDPEIFAAFQIGNRAIATYIRQRATHGKDITPESIAPPKWRPFQLAFILMNLALLGAAQKHWLEAGGKKNHNNPADPYMTLLGYFNSLRELGGSRRIVEDEVKTRLNRYSQRKRIGETTSLFSDRKIDDEPEELTSRVSTSEVSETKRRLESTFNTNDKVDVALATNMISVGLDITRLGLMVVLGQPKTAAEYIQATSRVGRDEEKPGLVVTLLNIHRPRDRSHYERFAAWHSSFYRAVEATSVTPFSSRAIDRGIAAITVALARLGHAKMTAPLNAIEILQYRQELEFVVDAIAKRAEMHDKELEASEAQALRQKVRNTVKDLLDLWERIAKDKIKLQYQREVGEAPPLIFEPLDPELQNQPLEVRKKLKAQRSLRDVEPTVNLWVINPNGYEVEPDSRS